MVSSRCLFPGTVVFWGLRTTSPFSSAGVVPNAWLRWPSKRSPASTHGLRDNHLELAEEKTEVLHLTGRKAPEALQLAIGSASLRGSGCVRYLGLLIEGNQCFRAHVRRNCEKAARYAGLPARILPNIRGGGYWARLLYYRVVESVVLYAAPAWAHVASRCGNDKAINAVQRAILARVARAYRTVSLDAVCVLAGVPPLVLVAEERLRIFRRLSTLDRGSAGYVSEAGRMKAEERLATLGL
nr:uncharacterized protein LOC117221128 [Megalopta genalis]